MAVFQDQFNDRVLHPQLLQHLHIGGVACLGLLDRRQAQLFKKNTAQLLSGVDIELLSGQIIDSLFVRLDLIIQHDAKLC